MKTVLFTLSNCSPEIIKDKIDIRNDVRILTTRPVFIIEIEKQNLYECIHLFSIELIYELKLIPQYPFN